MSEEFEDELAKMELNAAQQDLLPETKVEVPTRVEAQVMNLQRMYNHDDLVEIIGRLRGKIIDQKTESQLRATVIRFGEGDRYEQIKRQAADWNKFEGWRTGLKYFDDALMGVRPGEVTIIGGATNVGKTMLMLNLTASICVTGQRNVLYITLEQATERIEGRLFNIVQPQHHGLLQKHFSIQEHRPVGITELDYILAKNQHDFVVIDHLQFLAQLSPGQKEYDKMTWTTKALHDLALTYRVPIFAISHMNREGTKKTGLLRLYDFKGSGSIEGDSDNAFVINRDHDDVQNNTIIVTLEKNREKQPKELYQQHKQLEWDGIRLANSGDYWHYETENHR